MEKQNYILWTNLLLKTQAAESPSRGSLFFLYASWSLVPKHDYSMTDKKDKNTEVAWEEKSALCI